MSFLGEALACVTKKLLAGCSSGGADVRSRFAVTESTGEGASIVLTAKVDLSCARTAAVVRVTTKNKAAARHGILDCTRIGCVSSCKGVIEYACTLSFVNRCINKRTLIERPPRCQDRPFCRALHCRPVRPWG